MAQLVDCPLVICKSVEFFDRTKVKIYLDQTVLPVKVFFNLRAIGFCPNRFEYDSEIYFYFIDDLYFRRFGLCERLDWTKCQFARGSYLDK